MKKTYKSVVLEFTAYEIVDRLSAFIIDVGEDALREESMHAVIGEAQALIASVFRRDLDAVRRGFSDGYFDGVLDLNSSIPAGCVATIVVVWPPTQGGCDSQRLEFRDNEIG